MLKKNCNASDFTHRQIFKTLACDNLGGGAFKEGGPVHLHTLHIPKATTAHDKLLTASHFKWFISDNLFLQLYD